MNKYSGTSVIWQLIETSYWCVSDSNF